MAHTRASLHEWPEEGASGKTLLAQARAERRAGRLVNALDHITAGTRADPTDAEAWIERARLAQRLHRLEEARDAWRQAGHLRPDLAPVHRGLGDTYWALGTITHALQSYRRALRADPGHEAACAGAARCLIRLGEPSQALALWRSQSLHHPSTRARREMSRLVAALGENDAAPEMLDGECAREEETALERARHLGQQGRWSAALEQLEKAAEAAPRDLEVILARAETLVRLERFDEAAVLYAHFVEKETGSPAGQLAAARLARRAGLEAAARHHLQSLLAAGHDEAQLDAASAAFCQEEGLTELAFSFRWRAHRTDPKDLPCRLALERDLRVHALLEEPIVAGPSRRNGSSLRTPESLLERLAEIARRTPLYRPHGRRIVMVANALSDGGAERQTVNLLKGLAPLRGNEIEHISLICRALDTPRRRFHKSRLEAHCVPILTLRELPLPPGNDPAQAPELSRAARFLNALPARIRETMIPLALTFARDRPDVVHAWQDGMNIIAGFAAAIAGVPRIVLGGRNLRPDRRTRAPRHERLAYRLLLSLPNVVLTNNSAAGARDYAEWLALPPERVSLLPNGLDTDELDAQARADPQALRHSLNIPGNVPVVGGMGRIVANKRPALWIEAARLIAQQRPDVHFVLIGDGDLYDTIRSLGVASGLALRLHMPGRISEIAPWLRLMSVFLHTAAIEGLPNAVLEAQFAGLPVVATDVGGTAEALLPGISGQLLDPNPTPEAAATAVLALLDRPDLHELGRAGRDHVRRTFAMERLVERALALYGYGPPQTD